MRRRCGVDADLLVLWLFYFISGSVTINATESLKLEARGTEYESLYVIITCTMVDSKNGVLAFYTPTI